MSNKDDFSYVDLLEHSGFQKTPISIIEQEKVKNIYNSDGSEAVHEYLVEELNNLQKQVKNGDIVTPYTRIGRRGNSPMQRVSEQLVQLSTMESTGVSASCFPLTTDSKKPVAGFIIVPRKDITLPKYLGYSLNLPEETVNNTKCPDWENELKSKLFFHELGHILGAQESGADKFAALQVRKNFSDSSMPFIKTIADMRAVNLIHNAGARGTSTYDWEMVKVNDSVANMSTKLVKKNLTKAEKDIRSIDTSPSGESLESIFNIATSLHDKTPELWTNTNMNKRLVVANSINTDNFSQSDQQMLERYKEGLTNILDIM